MKLSAYACARGRNVRSVAHMVNLIGSAQAAKKFKVDRATFNRWVAGGQVPIAAELDGPTGARLFDADVIDALVAERTGQEASA